MSLKGDDMKFTIDSKELKNILQIVALRGKYNQGYTSKVSGLSSQVYIEATPNMVYFYNGDPSTFVVYRHECEAEEGVFCVDSNMMVNYLTDGDATIIHKEGKIKMLIGSSIVTFPSVMRSEHLNIVMKLKPFLYNLDYDAIKENESIKVTPLLSMKSRFLVRTQEFSDAMNLAERVGNSVYKLDFDGKGLTISSKTNTHEVTTPIWTSTESTLPATVEVSLPVGKILGYTDAPRVALCYEDDRPLVIATDEVTILRAPREEPK